MGQFAIECPQCGNYVTAYNGLRGLFQNRVTCRCGTKIDIHAERMTSIVCPSCRNSIVYDQSKRNPRCPVCKASIAPASGLKMVSFQCPQCGVKLNAEEGTRSYSCPICDCRIDVQRELAKQRYASEAAVSIIEYKGDNHTFVLKHPIENFQTGAQLIVQESQEAVFFRDGQALDVFPPGGHYTLETQNLPEMNKHYPLPVGAGRTPFHASVYFINLTTQMGIKWGTDSKTRLFDPSSGMHVAIGASGEFNIRVIDSKRILLKLVGTSSGLIMGQSLQEPQGSAQQRSGYHSDPTDMTGFFRAPVVKCVKGYLAKVIRQQSISVLELDEYIKEISDALQEIINVSLVEYGLTVSEFHIMRFVTPEDDPSDPMHKQYMEMKELYAQQYLGVRREQVGQATAEAARGRILTESETKAQAQLIGAQAEAEAYRLKAAAEAEEMRMKGYSYQQETARQVGLEAMQNGITGGSGGGSALGDIASLGITLGAMGSVVDMTRDALQGTAPGATVPGAAAPVTQGKPNAAEGSAQPAQDDPMAVLGKLKKMLDSGYISQEKYDAKVDEVLSRM
ncbi:MAG: SPFH domain-containing protein [Clostridiales bacterium]|nr:SPFH domain-containing protein [Clostridiales bacterium]